MFVTCDVKKKNVIRLPLIKSKVFKKQIKDLKLPPVVLLSFNVLTRNKNKNVDFLYCNNYNF